MPFDVKCMIFGGFEEVVEAKLSGVGRRPSPSRVLHNGLLAVERCRDDLLATCTERQGALCPASASALIARYQRIIENIPEVAEPSGKDHEAADAELATSCDAALRLAGLQAARNALYEAKATAQIDEGTAVSLEALFDFAELSLIDADGKNPAGGCADRRGVAVKIAVLSGRRWKRPQTTGVLRSSLGTLERFVVVGGDVGAGR